MSAARGSSWSTRLLSRSRDSTSRTVRSGPGAVSWAIRSPREVSPSLVDWGVEADVLAAPGHQVEHPLDLHAELLGDLGGLGVAAQLALEGTTGTADLV
jgi:hypothetical protein